jgi:hypothetical protein
MRKSKRQKITQLRKNIDLEKKDYLGNFDNISRSEIELNALEDAEMRKKLQSFKNFEILNTEKMTPRFLTLANISKKQCSLDCVTKPDGDNFGSAAEREAYILDFYSKLYQKKSTDQVLNENCIEEFLGHTVMGRGPHNFFLSSPSHLYSLSLAYSTSATSLPSHHNSHKYQTLYIILM